jgi:bacterioferritin
MFANDHEAEIDASNRYNAGILVCGDAKDFVTRELLEDILGEEDGHIDDIEKVQDQIQQMGLPQFLSTQKS